MIWFTQCRFCQFMVLCNEISDKSMLYQKRLSEIHNKLNCVRWEVDTPETNRHVGVAKSEHPRLTNGEIISEEFQPM